MGPSSSCVPRACCAVTHSTATFASALASSAMATRERACQRTQVTLTLVLHLFFSCGEMRGIVTSPSTARCLVRLSSGPVAEASISVGSGLSCSRGMLVARPWQSRCRMVVCMLQALGPLFSLAARPPTWSCYCCAIASVAIVLSMRAPRLCFCSFRHCCHAACRMHGMQFVQTLVFGSE